MMNDTNIPQAIRADKDNEMTFQQSMNRLQEIVNQLSNPQLELEKAMELFQEGLQLSRQCESRLKTFEKQMNTLMTDNGMPVFGDPQ